MTLVGQEDADRDRRVYDRGKRAGLAEAMGRPIASPRVEWLLSQVSLELRTALQKFDSFNSPHEGKAVIEEELDELWKHVKENTGRGVAAMDEAIQVAAMALRYVHDLAQWGPEGG